MVIAVLWWIMLLLCMFHTYVLVVRLHHVEGTTAQWFTVLTLALWTVFIALNVFH